VAAAFAALASFCSLVDHGIGEYQPPHSRNPQILIGERKVGAFERHFSFPLEVDMDGLEAKLVAGLLHIKVPKRAHALPTKGGVITIEASK
jgi:HSP20 family molecular chaperone IbpA